MKYYESVLVKFLFMYINGFVVVLFKLTVTYITFVIKARTFNQIIVNSQF